METLINYELRKLPYNVDNQHGIMLDWIIPKYGSFIRTIVTDKTTILCFSDINVNVEGAVMYIKLYKEVIRPILRDEYATSCIFMEANKEQERLLAVATGGNYEKLQTLDNGRTLVAEIYEEIECPKQS